MAEDARRQQFAARPDLALITAAACTADDPLGARVAALRE